MSPIRTSSGRTRRSITQIRSSMRRAWTRRRSTSDCPCRRHPIRNTRPSDGKRGCTAHADSASADDLFGAAGSVLGAIPPTPDTTELDAACGKVLKRKTPATLTPRQIAVRCQAAAVDTMRKFHALADPLYRLGVQTYQAGLAKNPFYRDALYNLTGISFMLSDTSKALQLAQRLYAVDPLNRLT